MEESKRFVKAALNSQFEIDHDAILASLQDEIDKHNAADHVAEQESRDEKVVKQSSSKFRFKSHTSYPRKRKHHTRHQERDRERYRRRHRKDKKDENGPVVNKEDDLHEAAHPFPREPTDPEQSGQHDANAAFRDSLFDALADDEGAAYWESVYNQPIHIYKRPSMTTAQGETEQMNDDEYAAYVQKKMWEKKNPHIVLERERKEKQRREEEEDRARRREDFIRRKERAAWEKSQQDGAKHFAGAGGEEEQGAYDYTFDFENARSRFPRCETAADFRSAWEAYRAAWDGLKMELLNARDFGSSNSFDPQKSSQAIPWPVLPLKSVTKPNIEEFMRHMPADANRSRLQQLKAERVRWHPDKMQQRFRGHVDEGTMKLVTGVFQVINAFAEKE